MRTLNLGILAHVDAGKTSLTERLLHTVGVIDEIGSVDEGTTQTDTLALERRRGITIKSAVVSFDLAGVAVNLLDTPGHPDFIAEVERVLSVLDGAVLVISAVEGVQAQTRVLMRALRRLRIPTIIFVNKIDRAGARYHRTLRSISDRLATATVPMGRTVRLGTRVADFPLSVGADTAFTARLAEVLADHDDALLDAYVADATSIPYRRLLAGLATQTRRAHVHPVFFGSAITGAGVGSLISGIRTLLPARDGRADDPASGTVFKVERGPAGERIAYVRLFAGVVRTRDRLPFPGGEGKVTAIDVFEGGSTVRRAALHAGQIGKLKGLDGIRIGDPVGTPRSTAPGHRFAPPTLEAVVVPDRVADNGALHVALTQLAEQDPLINLRYDGVRRQIAVSLYGEVQKEVVQATLADDFGVDVTFRETTTVHIERPAGTGAAVEFIGTEPNPFLGTVGLRVEPAPVDSGVTFRLDVEPGSMPAAFFTAVEETVRETLGQGLHGWQVTDCAVSMTHAGYWARQSHAHGVFDKSMSSTAGDFRNLTPLVLMTALRRAGTRVYEPIQHFRLDAPADALGAVLPVLARLWAVPRASSARGTAVLLEGDIPAARVAELEGALPGLTRGEGMLECAFDRYREVAGPVPSRPRSDHNPLDRKEYLLHVQRRV